MSKKPGIYLQGLGIDLPPYPAWRYHDLFPPVIVENTEADLKAQEDGWHEHEVSFGGNEGKINWRHDLEDMNAKQLVLFAMDEFGIELPVAVGEEYLMKCIWQLTKESNNHNSRMTLLAQTIEMDYDQELDNIRVMAKDMTVDEKEVVYL